MTSIFLSENGLTDLLNRHTIEDEDWVSGPDGSWCEHAKVTIIHTVDIAAVVRKWLEDLDKTKEVKKDAGGVGARGSARGALDVGGSQV